MEQGLIHIYCGDGKGKTSAAIGYALKDTYLPDCRKVTMKAYSE